MATIQNNLATPALLAAVNGEKSSGKTTAAEAQDRFMTLLVTQMKNQDPLNPMDNAQVTSQLAQLSTVTGIDKLNGTLESLKSSYQSSQSLQAAGMIGHGVLVPGSTATLGDTGSFLGADLAESADKVVVTIRDAGGNTIHTMNMGSKEAGTLAMQWDGHNDAGVLVPNGDYSFDVLATREGKKIGGVTPLAFGNVASVSTNAQGVKLNIPGIGSVGMSDVRQIL